MQKGEEEGKKVQVWNRKKEERVAENGKKGGNK